MKEEKAYKLLSRLIDNELMAHERFEIMRLIKTDPWYAQKHKELIKLRESLVGLPQMSLSPYFEANLTNKINNTQSQAGWLSRLTDYGVVNKVAYGVVTASIVFMAFVGAKIYFPGDTNFPSSDSLKTSTTPVSSLISTSKPGAYNQDLDVAIIDTKGYLNIHKGTASLRIKLDEDHPEIDPEKRRMFQGILNNYEYMRGMYLKHKGDFKKSRECLRRFVAEHPTSRLSHHIRETELKSVQVSNQGSYGR